MVLAGTSPRACTVEYALLIKWEVLEQLKPYILLLEIGWCRKATLYTTLNFPKFPYLWNSVLMHCRLAHWAAQKADTKSLAPFKTSWTAPCTAPCTAPLQLLVQLLEPLIVMLLVTIFDCSLYWFLYCFWYRSFYRSLYSSFYCSLHRSLYSSLYRSLYRS